MSKRIFILGLIIGLLGLSACKRDYRAEFQQLAAQGDTLGLAQLLADWERRDEQDPEIFVAYFNYYVLKSMQEVVQITTEPGVAQSLEIMPEDDPQGDALAFLHSQMQYHPEILQKGFDWIEKGIELYPSRLDMRFGRIYMLGQLGRYETFSNEVRATLDYSNLIDHQWLWTDQQPLEDPVAVMLGAVQDYQSQLFQTDDATWLPQMEAISRKVLQYFPDHVESLSNLAIVRMSQKQYPAALDLLTQAEALAPEDPIILGNKAYAYLMKGDTLLAIRYYELTRKYGDAGAQQFADRQLELLQKP